MKSRKFIKRTIASIFLTGFIGIVGLATLILNPQCLFANKLEHGKFTVYANFPIDENIKGIMDEAVQIVKNCEIYDAEYEYEIFFSYQTFYNKIDDLFFDPYAAARPTDNNLIVKAKANISQGLVFTYHSKIDMTYLLAHEIVHCYQHNKYGMLKFNPFNHPPIWKVEGYPEYVARQAQLNAEDYNLANEIKRFMELENEGNYERVELSPGHFAPKMYFQSRIMTEYLMDVKGLSYDGILQENVLEKEVIKEMTEWAMTQ